jgi:L-threonylcarbamoyladenylate synthase
LNKFSGKNIAKAAQILKKGGLVAIPTETVYGLAADARNSRAVAKIYAAKQRPSFNPLIIHFAVKEQLSKYIYELPPLFYELYEAFCPGPLTFILPKSAAFPDLVTAGNNTMGVRFPNHSLTRKLIEICQFPLAAPSANLFGKVSPTQASHVSEQLGSEINYLLDGGPCKVGIESTIIDLSADKPIILRLGGIPLEAIENIVGPAPLAVKTSSSNPQAPGMLSGHYAPEIKLLYGNLIENLKLINPVKTGSVSFCKKISGIPEVNQRVLSPKGNLTEAASNLFKSLRSFDPQKIELIVAEKFPEEGLGRAINDRLKRAALG